MISEQIVDAVMENLRDHKGVGYAIKDIESMGQGVHAAMLDSLVEDVVVILSKLNE